ncbi:hypothetical protein [Paraburkholderia susongensis]|uniref:Lipoprotein n=1 Tax=Paraburkholderia susongensis TaxID=1515439 RepID=A0A1X7JJD8_9BURK|nr:hypothetical protein [Paraburkholderia susongensis]SMG28249.1 hypothetical protein SAMN06265784_102739 [Paraburkholderia susongensis]
MKGCTITALVSAIALSGCLAMTPPVKNANGQPIKFVSPVLGKNAMKGARYVLIEKNIADGKYRVVSISTSRQEITNDRQERIAFNADLTGFAPDYTEYSFQTYTDRGNYGEQTEIMRCASFPQKTYAYTPCNSAFADVFVPMGVTKAYIAGQMGYAAKKSWDDPKNNNMRYVSSPQWALAQAGVFERLADLTNAK